MKVRIKGVRPYDHDGTFWKVSVKVLDREGQPLFVHTSEPVEGPKDCAVRVVKVLSKRMWPSCSTRLRRVWRARQFEKRAKKLGMRPFCGNA